MTTTASILEELLAECDARDVQLRPAGDGGLTIDAPKVALNPDLLARLKAHKPGLLAMLRPAPEVAPINQGDAAVIWQTALDKLEGDPLFPPSLLVEMRTVDVRWGSEMPDSDRTESPRTRTGSSG